MRIGVKGVSLVSDGESSISPAYQHTIEYGHSLGLSMASGTNAYLLRGELLERVFPLLTYLRVNISAGEESRYNEIMGAKGDQFQQVLCNIQRMVEIKQSGLSNCTIGMQMVFMWMGCYIICRLPAMGSRLRKANAQFIMKAIKQYREEVIK